MEYDDIRGGAATHWRPSFVREIRETAEATGLLHAVHDLLRRDNVTLEATGQVAPIQEHSGGMLFVGNHDKQFEFVALMDFLGQIGRTSMKNIVKFYVKEQINWGLGEAGTDMVLPVYPRLLAKDRRNKLNLELGSRVLFHKSLKTAVESKRLNDATLSAAADELAEGGVVNIFPCGSIVNSVKKPWRAGLGSIMARIPEDVQADVLVVPYHANSINRARLFAAVALRGRGVLGRPQNISIEFGRSQTVAEVAAQLPESDRANPVAITEFVRQIYMSSLL